MFPYCVYVNRRGDNKGKQCGNLVPSGEGFCDSCKGCRRIFENGRSPFGAPILLEACMASDVVLVQQCLSNLPFTSTQINTSLLLVINNNMYNSYDHPDFIKIYPNKLAIAQSFLLYSTYFPEEHSYNFLGNKSFKGRTSHD